MNYVFKPQITKELKRFTDRKEPKRLISVEKIIRNLDKQHILKHNCRILGF